MSSPDRIVRSGYGYHRAPGLAVNAFLRESEREQTRVTASRYCKLRAAVLDYLESRGLENEALYLTRLRQEVSRRA